MDNDVFSPDFNVDMHRNISDGVGLTVGNVTGGAVASIVDIGANLWNSLPYTPEADTKDIIGRISMDALNVYEEHPDLVHAASFIGGMFIPMGIATKGLNIARNGARATSWFGSASKAGRELELASVTKIFEEAGPASAAYKSALKEMYTKTAVNQAIDAVAMETALVMGYNAHPLMEDYMKDFGENFALSTAFSAVIGGAVGHAADRFILREATGGVSTRIFDETIGKLRPLSDNMSNVTALQSHEVNIGRLDEIMNIKKAEGKSEVNDMGYATALAAKQNILVTQDELFQSMISPELKELGKTDKVAQEAIKQKIISSKEMNGVENIRFLTEADLEAKNFIKPPKNELSETPSLTKDTTSGIKEDKEAVFFTDLGLYGIKSDIKHYAGANAYGISAEKMVDELKRINKNFYLRPDFDSSLEMASKTSAQIEREYISKIKFVDEMPIEQFAKIKLSETDGPMLDAIIMRMYKDPEAKKLSLGTSDRSPVYKKILEERTEYLQSAGVIPKAGPDASYVAAVDRIATDYVAKYKSHSPIPSNAEANNLVASWVGGSKQALNRMAVEWHAWQVGGFASIRDDSKAMALAKQFDAIYTSAESKELRNRFAQYADGQGNVYLYRGWKTNDIKGIAPLDSYTTHIPKAAQFTSHNDKTGVKLYKVPVEDIVAGFEDVGGGDTLAHRFELIVKASARPVEAELSDTGKIAFQKQQAAGAPTIKTTVSESTIAVDEGAKTANFEQLRDMWFSQKQEAIDNLLDQSFPTAVIAKRVNMNPMVVEAYAQQRTAKAELTLGDFVNYEVGPLQSINNIKNADDIGRVLSPENAPLILKGNQRKAQYIQDHIGLDNRTMTNIDRMIKLTSLRGSNSSAAKEVADVLEGYSKEIDILRQQVGKINNELAGSAFFGSFDFVTRKMGEAGPMASFLGKQFQDIGNRLKNRVVKPIEQMMSVVATDKVALIEFNTAMDLNAGLKEWRGFTPEGKLVQKKMTKSSEGIDVEVLVPVLIEGKEFQIKTPSVLNLVRTIQTHSAELRDLANATRRIKGQADISDIGFWVPSFNPVNKYISYVHDMRDDTVKMLWSKTATEHDTLTKAYVKQLQEDGLYDSVKVYRKGEEQKFWSTMNGRMDPITMERADIAAEKGGKTAQGIIKSDIGILGEIAGGYEHYISAHMRNLADTTLSEITDPLRQMSQLNKAVTKGQPFDKIKQVVTQPKDSAAMVHNVMLGGNNLEEYAGWQAINRSFETYLTIAANGMSEIYKTTVAPLAKTFMGGKRELTPEILNKIDYEKIATEMEARGIHNPWKAFDDAAAQMYGLSKIEDHKDSAKRMVYASNALAATVALRFGEIAQPIVNAMSLPILTMLAIGNKMPDSFMGAAKGSARISGTQIMFEGARAMNSPLFVNLSKEWERLGYYTPQVSEMTNLMKAARTFEKGPTAAIERGIDSKFVEVMSKPADYSESLVRKLTMHTGAVLAKKLYPELSDAGVTIFARDFMDKAVGNFHASQRPVFYQGTLGVALGLFQTYSLTLGQSVYRHLELKNYKEIGKAALLQSTIFGTKTLPGFDIVSNAIGEHFSDENYDLMTGTYRAIGDTAANFVLYGLPSNLGGANISSRGDADPRLPLTTPPVAYSMVSQTVQTMGQVAKGLSGDFPDMARNLGQAVSMQNMSRPLARGAELATGYSVTRQGNTVQVPEEAWTATGIISRIMGTRPIEEQKLREADHMNRFYGAIDRKNRQEAIDRLQTAMRNGNLTDEKLEKVAHEYLDHGGSPRGWKAAVQTVIGKTNTSGKEVFLEKLKPDSPFNYMIEHLDGQ